MAEPTWLTVILLSSFAGGAIPLGALFGYFEHIRPTWLESEVRHFIIALGAGALLAAVALVLVPEGSKNLSVTKAVIYFSGGSLLFMLLDLLLSRSQTAMSQLVAMIADFLPEALALGATIAAKSNGALLLAGIMALQNLPEGFNAYRELNSASAFKPLNTILAFVALAFLGPVAGLTGFLWLTDQDQIVAAIMMFSAGGIMYLIFQDIAPQIRLSRAWAPPLGASAGFLTGLVGHMLLR